MKKFEYKIEKFNSMHYVNIDIINDYGKEGWELTTILGNIYADYFYFKRELELKTIEQPIPNKEETYKVGLHIKFGDKDTPYGEIVGMITSINYYDVGVTIISNTEDNRDIGRLWNKYTTVADPDKITQKEMDKIKGSIEDFKVIE